MKEFRPGEGMRSLFPYITDNKDMAAEGYTANPYDHQDTVGVTAGTLAESQRQMAEEYRRGIAEALGVPPEAIREDVAQSWLVNWNRAFVKPEYLVEVAPTTETIRELGSKIGEISRSALYEHERLEMMRKAQPPMAEQPQRTEEEPFSSSLSVDRL